MLVNVIAGTSAAPLLYPLVRKKTKKLQLFPLDRLSVLHYHSFSDSHF